MSRSFPRPTSASSNTRSLGLFCWLFAALAGAEMRAAVLPEGIELVDGPAWCAASEPTLDSIDGCSSWQALPEDGWPAGWTGLGWVRWTLEVDRPLEDRPLGLAIVHLGAAEIVVDGRLIGKIGELGTDAAFETAHRSRELLPIVFRSSEGPRHEIAILYSSFTFEQERWRPWEPFLDIGLRATSIEEPRISRAPKSRHNSVLIGLMLAFTALHSLLFVFERREVTNLAFAGLSASCAASLFFLDALESWTTPEGLWSSAVGFRIGLVLVTIFFVAFVQRFTGRRRPRALALFVAAGLGLAVWTLFRPLATDLATLVFSLTSIPETLWCFSDQRSRRDGAGGWWLIPLGALPLLATGFGQILLLTGVVSSLPVWLQNPFGSLAVLMLAMSIFLARRFALTTRELEARLEEVERLSEETLRQEVERARLEAENERKGAELEEARRLQLSMLPREAPTAEAWEVAARMETAVEVGGDYYDFHLSEGDTLTCAVGDATGHGLQAGILVAATKALFSAHADRSPGEILARTGRAIHAMGLRRRLMSLLIFRLQGSLLTLASAGMPPVWIRRSSGEVEEIAIPGFPLGARAVVEPVERKIELAPGDLVLALTDGLPESPDADGELFGYERIKTALAEVSLAPEEAIDVLAAQAERWRDGPPQDDQTLVALRLRSVGG